MRHCFCPALSEDAKWPRIVSHKPAVIIVINLSVAASFRFFQEIIIPPGSLKKHVSPPASLLCLWFYEDILHANWLTETLIHTLTDLWDVNKIFFLFLRLQCLMTFLYLGALQTCSVTDTLIISNTSRKPFHFQLLWNLSPGGNWSAFLGTSINVDMRQKEGQFHGNSKIPEFPEFLLIGTWWMILFLLCLSMCVFMSTSKASWCFCEAV